ncbi:MAG: peroxiredoxin [Verrucomicrobiota bacterium]
MKTIALSLFSIVLVARLGLGLTAVNAASPLKVGDPAPPFELQGSDGKTYKLSNFKGKQVVVLAWFPKAFTTGCTAECKSLHGNGDAIRKFDVAYFTASCDDAETNKKFAESLKVDYPILSDPKQEAATAYGVVNAQRKVPFRWTYYIGKDGRILYIDDKVQTESHGADIAARLKELGVPLKK